MTEKKLFVNIKDLEDIKIFDGIREATPQDLKELGWVRAEPTNCDNCIWWLHGATFCGCHKEDQNRGGLNLNEICLDFKPKEAEPKRSLTAVGEPDKK